MSKYDKATEIVISNYDQDAWEGYSKIVSVLSNELKTILSKKMFRMAKKILNYKRSETVSSQGSYPFLQSYFAGI
ncbi:hypothetical protein LIT25_26470 (plasmid) [Bacillus sp. F19]|nr:hypothetical protein LIT25_26470 [Bacillus sp. F19]